MKPRGMLPQAQEPDKYLHIGLSVFCFFSVLLTFETQC